jgi:hypothetical protein
MSLSDLSNINISSGVTYNIINGIGGIGGVLGVAAGNGTDTSLTSLGVGTTYISKGGGAGGVNGGLGTNAVVGPIGTSSAGGAATTGVAASGGGVGSIKFNGDPAFFVYNTYAHDGAGAFTNAVGGGGGGGGAGSDGLIGIATNGGNGGNGIFINITKLSDSSLVQLEEYINYVNAQEKHLSEFEEQKKFITKEYFDSKSSTM